MAIRVQIDRIERLFITGAPEAVRVLLCRAYANACTHPIARPRLLSVASMLLSLMLPPLGTTGAAHQKSIAAAVANTAVMLLQQRTQMVEGAYKACEDCLRTCVLGIRELDISFLDAAATLLLIQSLATLSWGDVGLLQLAHSAGLERVALHFKDASPDERVKNVARDVQAMLTAATRR